MSATSARSRVEHLLRRFGAEKLQHTADRTLYEHLAGTWAILSRWGQPDWICDAGAFHSVYGTDSYQGQLVAPSARRRVRAAVGDRAERVVHLFSVMRRRTFVERIESIDDIPATGMRIPRRGPLGGEEEATHDEVVALLVLLVANQAEQACAPDGSPGLWVARANALALKAEGSGLPVPPVFDACRAHVRPEDESAARAAYRAGLLAWPTDRAAARRDLARAAGLLPWVGEPVLWLAYLDLQQGDRVMAAVEAARGRELLEQWGIPWDKRMTFEQWTWLAGAVVDGGAGPVELGPLPVPQADALPGFRDALRHRTRQVVFLGDPRSEGAPRGSERLKQYLASFVTNTSDPSMKRYPGLASRPWHEADAFPLARALADNYDAIRSEILALDEGGFAPESERIVRSGSWDVLFFFERGRKHEVVCQACPVTTRVLEEHRAIRTLAGLIYVSRLRPGSHVAPHCGPTNMRLRCHLGIEIPDGNCGIRVQGQTRRWLQGGCIVFDDFLLHEAWNHASTDRIVLIVDLWHPDLEPEEIAMLEGLQRYAGAQATSLGEYWRANEQVRGRNGATVPPRGRDEPASDYLGRLQSLGTFLFHGSPRRAIRVLQPCPATDDSGGVWGNDTSVYAVPAVIAVGRAVLPARDLIRGHWGIHASRDPDQPGGPMLHISPNVKLGRGSVYVVEARGFQENPELHEWKCPKPVRVLAEIPVTVDDYVALGGRVETLPAPSPRASARP